MDNNTKLRDAIKVRHLADAITENWEQLAQVNARVQTALDNATLFIIAKGKPKTKEKYQSKINETYKQIEGVGEILATTSKALKKNEKITAKDNWDNLQHYLNVVEQDFTAYENYPKEDFENANYKDWENIWQVIKSNLLAVIGITESAYIKAQMLNNFNAEEEDTLTKLILKNIPRHFSIAEAEKYEQEYLQAMEDIEREANQNTNLWDRFLNVLAGAISFKQTPEERVMMKRWVEGEKGDL